MDTRLADRDVVQREVTDYLLSRLNTACPGKIESFDPDTQTVTVTPAVQMKVIVDDTVQYVTLPQVIKCPVIVPTAAVQGFILTLPISAGDPCLILFSQRCIDNWLQQGGIQRPEDVPGSIRHHALTDALVLLAPTPLPQTFPQWLTNGIEMRNRGRTTRVTVFADRAEIKAENGAVSSLVVVKNDGTVTVTSTASITATAPLIVANASTSATVNTPNAYVNASVKLTVDSPWSYFTGRIEVVGNIYSHADVLDSVRSMAADRTNYFNAHTHISNLAGYATTTPTPQE